MSYRWRFLDPVDSTSAFFDINPQEGGSPALSRNVTEKSTVAVGGKSIKFEGSKLPDHLSFSGIIYNQAMLDLVTLWFEKRHAIQIRDDLGRTSTGLIQKYDPKRVRFGHNFWRHEYTVEFLVVSWA